MAGRLPKNGPKHSPDDIKGGPAAPEPAASESGAHLNALQSTHAVTGTPVPTAPATGQGNVRKGYKGSSYR